MEAVGQAFPTAEADGILQIGGEAVGSHSNYLPYDTQGNPAPLSDLQRSIKSTGFGLYTTFDFKEHFGVALDLSRTTANDDSSAQLVYEAGFRYVVIRAHGFEPYARISFGRGLYTYTDDAASLGFNLYSFAAGVDYRLSHSFILRTEYQTQRWIAVPLRDPSPELVKIGVAYRFHGDLINRVRH